MIYLYMLAGGLIGFVGAAVTGFYEGYKICSQTAQVKALRIENKRLTLANSYYKSAYDAAQVEQNKFAQSDQENTALIIDLKSKLAAGGTCIYDVEFLKKVDKLQ